MLILTLFKQLNPENRDFLQKVAFLSFAKRFEEPTPAEGFDQVLKIDFVVSFQLLLLLLRSNYARYKVLLGKTMRPDAIDSTKVQRTSEQSGASIGCSFASAGIVRKVRAHTLTGTH